MMALAYRDRRQAERDWEVAKLTFLARAFGAEVRDAPPARGPTRGTIERLAQGRHPLASVTYVD